MGLYRLGSQSPSLGANVYIAPNATVIGHVALGANVSVWFGATLRGDNDLISIGSNSNVQDSAVLHTDPGFPLTIGENVTIGHQAMLHGCTIGDGSLIGIQSVILNGAVIGKGSLVGAGAIITERKVFPGGSLILGAPAKVARELRPEESARLIDIADNYVQRHRYYRDNLVGIG